MANIATLTETWATTYAAEIVLKPIVHGSNLWQDGVYFVDTTVNGSKTYYLQDETTNILQASSCTWNPQGSTAIGEKTITTCELKVNFEQCYTSFEDSIFKSTLGKGTAVSNLEGTVAGNSIIAGVMDAAERDSYDMGWFGDTDNAATTNLELCDGWFKKIQADADVKKVNITNFGALAADEALGYLRSVEEASDQLIEIENENDKIYLVTKTIYANLLKTYEALGTDSGLERVENGGKKLMFRGVEVSRQLRWDKVIAANQFPDPHRIVYTKRGNLILGTDITDDPGSDAIIWTDLKDDIFRTKFHFDMGTDFFFAEYLVYAR